MLCTINRFAYVGLYVWVVGICVRVHICVFICIMCKVTTSCKHCTQDITYPRHLWLGLCEDLPPRLERGQGAPADLTIGKGCDVIQMQLQTKFKAAVHIILLETTVL